VLAALINVTDSLGYPVLFILVMIETLGIPVPGETALITAAAVGATKGHLMIEVVIVVAAAAAIVGDNIGFMIGRRGGRTLLERPGRYERQRHRFLEVADPFFERHGPKAVFFGRWIAGLRIWAAWLAGTSDMRWHVFFFWNALGGTLWAISIGLLAYFGGTAVVHVAEQVGVYAAIAVVVAIGIAAFYLHRRRTRK
jgi:membrane protein DedA with SNARE-associated domain